MLNAIYLNDFTALVYHDIKGTSTLQNPINSSHLSISCHFSYWCTYSQTYLGWTVKKSFWYRWCKHFFIHSRSFSSTFLPLCTTILSSLHTWPCTMGRPPKTGFAVVPKWITGPTYFSEFTTLVYCIYTILWVPIFYDKPYIFHILSILVIYHWKIILVCIVIKLLTNSIHIISWFSQ